MTAIHDIDFGTPRSLATGTVTLTIDGIPVTVPSGTPSIDRKSTRLNSSHRL